MYMVLIHVYMYMYMYVYLYKFYMFVYELSNIPHATCYMYMCMHTGVNTLSSFYTKDTLIKDVKKLDIRPEMLEVCLFAMRACL